jgi:rod shape-determining protein MreB
LIGSIQRTTVSPDLAIDLGTSRTRIALKGRGIVCDESTVVLRAGRETLAVGDQALQDGARGGLASLVRPVVDGVVEDYSAAESMLKLLLRRSVPRTLFKPRALVTLDGEVTEVGRRAVQDSLRAAGARDVVVLEAATARALGVGLNPAEPVGSLILDIGAGGSRLALVSMGGVVIQRRTNAGGNRIERAIETWLLQECGLMVGANTAANLAQHVADVSDATIRQTRIRGRDPAGAPHEQVVGTQDLNQALQPVVLRIRDSVRALLADTSPELSADLLDRGLILTGACSQLRGLDSLLRADSGLPVLLIERPDHAEIMGAYRLLDNPAEFQALLPTT